MDQYHHHMLARQAVRDDAKSRPHPSASTIPSPVLSLPQPPPPTHAHHGPLPTIHNIHDSVLPSISSNHTLSAELAPIASSNNDYRSPSLSPHASHNILPPIATLTDSLAPLSVRSRTSTISASPPAPLPVQQQRPSPPRLTSWPSLNPLTTYYTPSHAQAADSPNKMDVEMSETPRQGSVSLDDPDVRMAAEALGDLRADFVSTPKQPPQPQPQSQQQPEPLLQLLTTSHPLLAKTIEGTTSAYNTSKNFSPRFKSGAEYVEGYLTPIGNTLGSVGRVTGVEGGVRWFLRGTARRQPLASSDLESGDGSRNKRRRMMTGDGDSKMDGVDDRPAFSVMSPPQPSTPTEFDPFAYRSKERRTSMSTVDSLPAYDDHRSPAYTEAVDEQRSPASSTAAWQSRLIMSTSGLSIAMSEESLRSLKYCLQWLRWANDHVARVIGALKVTLEQFEQHPVTGEVTSKKFTVEISLDDPMALDEAAAAAGDASDRSVQSTAELGQRVAALKSDLIKTLRAVMETVSKYAGGALPENARVLVRRHLTSLPQRFRVAHQVDQAAAASSSGDSEKEVREGAQRVLVLAQEGLDMMAQISGVLDGTIVSAEEWCARLGKKKHDERASLAGGQGQAALEPLTGVGIDGDAKMDTTPK